MGSILPNTINTPHLSALDEAIEDMVAAADTTKFMAYMIDTVDSGLLVYLADQFDVLGYSGYRLATTDLQRRAIIKAAIELKKYRGTVWAIKQAMIAVGYGGAQLVESAGTVADGHDWARFKVVANLGNTAPLSAAAAAELTELINEYKNARSELIAIEYVADVTETLPLPSEVLDYEFHTDLDDYLFTGGFKYDGTYKYNGSQKYKPGIEDLQIQIIP